MADDWERASKAGREGRLTESQCRKVISDIYELAIGEPLHFLTARGYLDEWVESKKAETEPRTYMKYSQTIREFLNHVGIKADRLLREITKTDVLSWRDKLKRDGHSAPTINDTIKILRMPFRAAHELGYIDVNPCAKAAVRPVRDKVENASRDAFTHDQILELIKHAEGDWKGVILCAYCTGLRLRDVTELRWNAIQAETNTITVTTRKTGKKVTVPIHRKFHSWLKKQTRGIGKAPVFPDLAGKSGAGKSGLSMQFKRIMHRAGIHGRLLREAEGQGRSQHSLSFHSLRHSFNSAMANAGVSQEIRQKLTGHSSAEMNKVYTHHELEPLRNAIAAIPI
jgi:integrase